jgi:benzoyl-CoA reductase subunit D
MITAGVDCGSKNVKVIILKDNDILSSSLVLAGIDTGVTAEEAYEKALKTAGIAREQVEKVISTGAGKTECKFADATVTEVGADARGIIRLFPDVRTVIDVGAEEGRAVRVNAEGKVVDFSINEKCAAGAGAFTEAMARALEVKLEELGELSLKSTQAIPMNAQCTVFAESEVVTLVHRKTPKSDMARAIHDAIADRITSMVRRVGIEHKIALIGGVARNIGFVKSLNEDLQTEVIIPEDPEFVSALGAAVIATDK